MINELLSVTEKEYRIKIHKHSFIHDTEKTRVLSLQTNKGKFVLKTLYQPIERQLFILEAEHHLRKKKIRIPKTKFTKAKQPFFVWQGHPYVLQEWVDGKPYPLKNIERIKRVGAFLGKLHHCSQGFRSLRGDLYNGGTKWKQSFEESIMYLKEWKTNQGESSSEKIAYIIDNLDLFIEAGEKVYEKCIQDPYFQRWIHFPLRDHFLCHGDFHTNNLLVSESKFYCIDWEDVRYDFPSKDLTRILSFMMMKRYPEWSAKRFEVLFSGYLKNNPLSAEEKHLLFLDMAFPHIVVRHLKKNLYNHMTMERLKIFITAERHKVHYMLDQTDKYEGAVP